MVKQYFTIGEVAQQLAVAPSLIRFWEKEFRLYPHKNTKGMRRYTKKDIMMLTYIYGLVKDKGYSLAGARRVIEKHSTSTPICPSEVVDRLHMLRQFLVSLQKDTQKI